jgi:hypothetical protein
MQSKTPTHSFHIPVMGLAFTIDTPIKVARFGINSVISIVQDNLIEKMRSYYFPFVGEPYMPISTKESDHRAKRITDYLNLVNRIVQDQAEKLRATPFEAGSEIDKYFEMLTNQSQARQLYLHMLSLPDSSDKTELQHQLRNLIKPGSIDVNIMTKLDRENKNKEGVIIEDGSDAVAALRGFANSSLTDSSVILSAGMNPRLFSYMERLTAFDADQAGVFQKKIVIKVSDYRSALIQGKMLAKKGLWVSEFRIESGLNCGGHAFATDGFLLGPILEEFKMKKSELTQSLFESYNNALATKGKQQFVQPHPIKITVQGGIGTYEEDELLRQHYKVDGTGWGTPFLLVPEATTVDDHTLSLLSKAGERDIELSRKSPLGVRFHYLKGSTAEEERNSRIQRGIPGSPCTEKYLVSNTEFGEEPICTASRSYQQKKIEQLQTLNLPEEEYKKQLERVLDKDCLCVGLSNAAVKKYSVKPFKNLNGINICPGPNIAYFTEIIPLQKMVDHIYGRDNVIHHPARPHMFIKELMIYVDYWTELLTEARVTIDQKQKTNIQNFQKNLLTGISYYRDLSEKVNKEFNTLKHQLDEGLNTAQSRLEESLAKFLEKELVSAR